MQMIASPTLFEEESSASFHPILLLLRNQGICKPGILNLHIKFVYKGNH